MSTITTDDHPDRGSTRGRPRTSLRDPDRRIRRALVFTPMETDLELLIDAAVHAEDAGFEAVVVPEGWGLDATLVLSEMARATSHIRIVAGVLSVWGRTAGTLAMTAATLDRLSHGRFTLGLGASTPQLVAGLHDQDFTAPATRVSATVTAVRTLLRGERLEVRDGRGLKLGTEPRPDVPIWIAALGERSTRTAVRAADAWFPVMIPLDRIDDVRRDAAALRPDSTCELVTGPVVCADVGPVPSVEVVRQLVGWYLTGMGPLYAAKLAALGHAEGVQALLDANPRPRPGSLVFPPEAEPLLRQLAAFGTVDEIGRTLDAWDRVADLVTVLVPPGIGGGVHAVIDAAAPARNRMLAGAGGATIS